MKTLFIALIISVLIVAVLITLLIRQEQQSMLKLRNLFISVVRKFDSWQMMR